MNEQTNERSFSQSEVSAPMLKLAQDWFLRAKSAYAARDYQSAGDGYAQVYRLLTEDPLPYIDRTLDSRTLLIESFQSAHSCYALALGKASRQVPDAGFGIIDRFFGASTIDHAAKDLRNAFAELYRLVTADAPPEIHASRSKELSQIRPEIALAIDRLRKLHLTTEAELYSSLITIAF
jgi:hypothetical protein